MIALRCRSEDRSVAPDQAKKPRVFLHIGHPKTGSSAFQTCLARSHQALAAEGFLYPYHRSFARASRNHISSGNLTIGPEEENWLTAAVQPVLEANRAYHTIIFSNENLIHRLADFTSSAEDLRDRWDFQILLVVRDPIDQLSSVYQQLVKRHGYTRGYEEFLQEHHYRCNATSKAAAALQALDETGIDYSLFNYSALSNKVIGALVQAIGIRDGLVESACDAPVNRSMSAAELQLLLFVNAMYGRSVGRNLADNLVNQLPQIEPVSLAMKPESLQEVIRINTSSVEAINRRLPADAQLAFKASQGFSGDLHCDLSEDQLKLSRDILAGAIEKNIQDAAQRAAVRSLDSHHRQWQHQSMRLMTIVSRLLQKRNEREGDTGLQNDDLN